MYISQLERNRTAGNALATLAACGLLGTILGIANLFGARSDREDIAIQNHYYARHIAELQARQRELEQQIPKGYTSGGKRLLPKTAPIAHYPTRPIAPIAESYTHRRRAGVRLTGIGALALVAAGTAAWAVRLQRTMTERRAADARHAAAATEIIPICPRVTLSDVQSAELPPPQPAVYGTPATPSLRERRAAQLAPQPQAADPFAVTLNYEWTSLTPLPEAPAASAQAPHTQAA